MFKSNLSVWIESTKWLIEVLKERKSNWRNKAVTTRVVK